MKHCGCANVRVSILLQVYNATSGGPQEHHRGKQDSKGIASVKLKDQSEPILGVI